MANLDLATLSINIVADSSQAQREMDNVAKKSDGIGKSLKKGLAAAGKAAVAGVAAGSAAYAKLGKDAVSGYADYEQYVGGIETLYGENADMMLKYADEAYMATGQSANEYLDNVIGFSASMMQGLDGDTEAAAERSNMAMVDMADNANKMGTSMESLQNAYKGFAKGNFTMLDNLALGYGGTREEMQRLLADAEKLTGKKYDISNFADITEAIHAVQTQMGITGTTAEEASTTISGSLNSVKAAWQNLLTGLGTSKDVKGLVDGFVSTVRTGVSNVITSVKTILPRLTEAIILLEQELLPMIPGIINDLLPLVIQGGTTLISGLVNGIVSALPAIADAAIQGIMQLIGAIQTLLPVILNAGMQVLTVLAAGLVANMPQIIQAATDIIFTLVNWILQNLPQIIEVGLQIIVSLATGLINAIPQLQEKVPEIIVAIIDTLINSIPAIVEAGFTLLVALVEDMPNIIANIVMMLPNIISAIVQYFEDNWQTIKDSGYSLLTSLVGRLAEVIPVCVEGLRTVLSNLVSTITEFFEPIAEKGEELLSNMWDGISGWASTLYENVKGVWNSVLDTMSSIFSLDNIKSIGTNLVEGLWNGISDAKQWVLDKLTGWCGDVIGWFKGLFGINSPSTVMAEMGGYLMEGFNIGMESEEDAVLRQVRAISNDITGAFNPQLTADYDVHGALAGVGQRANAGGRTGSTIINQTNNFTSRTLSPYEQQQQIRRLDKQLAEVFA